MPKRLEIFVQALGRFHASAWTFLSKRLDVFWIKNEKNFFLYSCFAKFVVFFT